MSERAERKRSHQAALALVLGAVLVLGGCASRRDAAPVVERSPASAKTRPAPVRAVVAVAESPSSPAAERPAPEGYYIVKRGDTLYSIALEHGADYREVAQWNGLDDPTKIYVGQQLRVTEPPAPKGVQVGAVRAPSRVEARPLDTPEPKKDTQASGQTQTAKSSAPDPKASSAKPATTAPFIWPAKGKVIAGFGESRSKGIDIDGKPGDPVVAAADGRVTYTGTGIPGLGKLVVIKHDNGFITVYAHNQDILVKEQQAVSQGQKIAELGRSDADRPKLHFQIRKGSSPVDPMRYLPGT